MVTHTDIDDPFPFVFGDENPNGLFNVPPEVANVTWNPPTATTVHWKPALIVLSKVKVKDAVGYIIAFKYVV